jgi:methyl-accepting chemotaxis protein
MKNPSTMKIGTKLSLGFGAMALLIIILAAFALSRLYGIDGIVESQNKIRTEKLEQLYSAREALDQTGIAARNAFIFTSDADANRELDILDQNRVLYLDAVSKMTPVFKGDADFEKAKKGLLAMAEELKRPRKYRSEGKMQEYGDFLVKECSPLRRQIVADIDVVLKSVQGNVDAQSRAAEAAVTQSVSIIITVGALALLVAVVVGVMITRGLLGQLGGELDAVAGIARSVAQGDLAVRVVTSAGDKTSVMAAMKEMRDSLADIVAQVRTGTETIATASGEIAAGNMDLSSRTEQQASSLEETASSMEELTSTVKQNAENARAGNEVAIAASQVAIRGGEVMNAAVEAARAGEQGRGFAVVATEVRSLAQKSAAAAKEIKSLIGDSVERIGTGSKLVTEAGATMEEIVDSVKRVTTIMGEILIASKEQSDGIEQVNKAIGQMDDVTQQNAALVEQAAAAAASLREQTGSLSQAVSVFRLDGEMQTSFSAPVNEPVLALAHSITLSQPVSRRHNAHG